MNCDYCKQQMNYAFYINDSRWIKVVGEERFDKNVGRVCAHCTLERLGGCGWYIVWNEPADKMRANGSVEPIKEIIDTVDDAVMRVGASANCYNEPADANSGAEYVAARVRGVIVAAHTRQAQRGANTPSSSAME